MTCRPLLTAALIARNEKHNVRRCLDALWPWVDEVVVADTGSTDGTIAEFKRYAQRRKQNDKLKISRFTDCNDEAGEIVDFAAARQAADQLATGEWLVWCDMDDEIRGLEQLRKMAEDAPTEIAAFFCRYRYAADGDGNAISELWRERLVRNDGTEWEGRLHEHKLITKGAIVKVDPTIAEWIHHRDHTQRTGERNTRILEAWDRDEPDNPRILHSLGMEYMGSERYQDASDTFARYLALPGEPPDRRAQATRHMCMMLLVQNRAAEAKAAALASFADVPLWADTHLTLAEVAQSTGRPAEGLFHAQCALQIGQPETLLIINPLQYTAHPRALMAVCMAQMGRFEEAVRQAQECLQIAPSYQLAQMYLPTWQAMLKKQHTTASVLALAEVLVESGEPLKALALLRQAPFYVEDDEHIVRRRRDVAGLIADRQDAPAATPEDPAADAFVARHCEEPEAA